MPGLGDRFKATFYARVEQIVSMPLAHPVTRFDDIRTALFRRFPYLVFSAVETETVFVLSVQYAGLDPAWLREIAAGRR